MSSWQSVTLVGVLVLVAGCGSRSTWADPERGTRFLVVVRGNGFERFEFPVTLTGDFPSSARVVEIDEDENVIDDAIPVQIDFGRDLTFLPEGGLGAEEARLFHVYLGEGTTPDFKPLLTVRDNVMHAGQESLVVNSPGGVYYYHKNGGGFASLIDRDGTDWISHRPGEGAAGEYRGIPNLIHPEGGLHPGSESCDSRLLADGPLMARLHSKCAGGWEAKWDIYPHFARLTVLQVAHPYWFLYEGTPGGQLDLDGDYWVQADGARRPVSEEWDGRLDRPRWVYFGDQSLERVLYLVHHEDDGDYDQFYQMEGQMTVFGFGRKLRCCEKSLEQTPAEFTIGFVGASDHETVSRRVNAVYHNLIVSKGEIESRTN